MVTTDRDKAMIHILLWTEMKIGALLKVKLSYIGFDERKISIYQGEAYYQGRF